MATSLKDKKRKIERKYSKLIGATIERMKDKTMQELWVELGKLEERMAVDLEKAGIKLSES